MKSALCSPLSSSNPLLVPHKAQHWGPALGALRLAPSGARDHSRSTPGTHCPATPDQRDRGQENGDSHRGCQQTAQQGQCPALTLAALRRWS